MKVIKTSVALLLIFLIVFAASKVMASDIVCSSEICNAMTPEELDQLDRIINEQLSNPEVKSGSNIAIMKPVKLNLELSEKNLRKLVSGKPTANSNVKSDLKIVASIEDLELFRNMMAKDKKSKLKLEKTDNFMSFRYVLDDDGETFFSADVYLEREMLNREQMYVRMNTLGFGTHVKDGWMVEIGMIKSIAGASKDLKKLSGKPDGILLMVNRRW